MKLPVLKIGVSVIAFMVGIVMVGVWYLRGPLPVVDVSEPHGCIGHSTVDRDDGPSSAPRDILEKFKEVSLEKDDADSVFRLIWFPTFHSPTSIRVSLAGDQATVTTRRLSGKGGYDWGYIDFEAQRSITTDKWLAVKNAVNESCFWYASPNIREVPVMDGSTWLFEGRVDKRYNFIRRITPSPQMTEIFRTMMRVSGEDLPDGYLSPE